ncbi:MAG: phosphopantetheine-binding protein [Polyangiaceae bacterium]|nr:phosphopantetheine-binding protein [Polyangiaceae bacterium]
MRALARARFELRGAKRGARIRCYGALDVPHPRGVAIGQRVAFLGGPIPTSLRCHPGAELIVGDRTICNYGAALIARRSVRIGTDCMIASQVYISDDDGRNAAPIVIGNGVWVAHGAVIEPGTIIGDGAVISSLAVVSGVVPAHSLAAGNPAQAIPLSARAAQHPAVAPPPSTELTIDVVRSAIIEWLDDSRCFGDAASRITSDSMSLHAAGLLDSLGLVQLILMLERRFGVAIDRDRAARPESQSVRGFVDCFVARKAT